MRRLIVVAWLAGCGQNPAFDQESGAEDSRGSGTTTGSTSVVDPGTTTGGEATGVPTSGTGAVVESATGDDTTGVDPTTTTTSSTGTTGDVSTSEGSGSTGEPVRTCVASEDVALDVEKGLISDTGVAPAMMMPCFWQGACEQLNFGRTEYYRLINKPELGKNAAVIRFDIGLPAEIAEKHGYEDEDLIGYVLSLVAYEPRNVPVVATQLQIDAPRADNVMFAEGDKKEMPAMNGDSSEACRDIVDGFCVQWAESKPVYATGVKLGTIDVTAEAVQDNDYDGSNNNTYHSQLRSSFLAREAMVAASGEAPPTFVVYLATERGTDGDSDFGIKLEESPEKDPALAARFCTLWSDD